MLFRYKELSGIDGKLQFIAASITQLVQRLDDGGEISSVLKNGRPSVYSSRPPSTWLHVWPFHRSMKLIIHLHLVLKIKVEIYA